MGLFWKSLVILITRSGIFSKGKRRKLLDRDMGLIPVNRCGNNFKAVLQIMFERKWPKAPLNAVKGILPRCILVGVLFFNGNIYSCKAGGIS